MQKNYKKQLNGSKDSNLKNQAISEILPNFAPIFRGGGVDRDKIVLIDLKVHFKSYSNMKSDSQSL